MGRRGPPKKPTNLRVLEGNPSKRPLPENEVKPPPLAPECPKWLTPAAKRIWRDLAGKLETLGLLTVVDGYGLAAACENYATWQECQRFMRRKDPATKKPNGRIFVTPNGYVQQRPEWTIGQKALAEARAWFAQFGIAGPASRVGLNVQPDTGGEDPMEKLLNQAGG